MKFESSLSLVGDQPLFETGLLLAGNVDPNDIRRQLSRWVKAGKIRQLRRGLYMLEPPHQSVAPHPFLIANALVPGSYVSEQSALAYYGLIPEYAPRTVSVTTLRPSQLNLQHHDKASLLAGKLHAILQRPYPKGRDIYDLTWYLEDRNWPNPNIKMLNNALAQTDWTGPTLTVANWRSITLAQIESFSWDQLISDVQPFLQVQQEIELLTKDNLIKLLKND